MLEGYKIVCVTPAGRRRYMRLLAPYILSSEFVDEWHIWINTKNSEDIGFLERVASVSPKVRLIPHPENKVSGNSSINDFFKYCIDEDTVYIRFDDDIVWVEEQLAEKLVSFRIRNPQYFLVFPLIINNAICTHLLQQRGKIDVNEYIPAQAMGKTAWKNPKFAHELHEWFLKKLEDKKIADVYIDQAIPIALNRFSINCMSWFGRDFKEMD